MSGPSRWLVSACGRPECTVDAALGPGCLVAPTNSADAEPQRPASVQPERGGQIASHTSGHSVGRGAELLLSGACVSCIASCRCATGIPSAAGRGSHDVPTTASPGRASPRQVSSKRTRPIARMWSWYDMRYTAARPASFLSSVGQSLTDPSASQLRLKGGTVFLELLYVFIEAAQHGRGVPAMENAQHCGVTTGESHWHTRRTGRYLAR